MASQTVYRLKKSNSIKVALAGMAVILVSAIVPGGIWSGIFGVLGMYFVFLAGGTFTVLEVLRMLEW